MKKFTLSTVDNYTGENRYAKILSLDNTYGGVGFFINSWTAILDVYQVGAFGEYGTHVKYAISWEKINKLKIVQLTRDLENIIPDNILAYVPTEKGLDLYVASKFNYNSQLMTRIDVLAFNNNGKWINKAIFEDISNLNAIYYAPTRKITIDTTTLKKVDLNTFFYKRKYSNENNINIDLSQLGSAIGTFFIEVRSYTASGGIKGIDIIISNKKVATRQPYTLKDNEIEIEATFDSDNNILNINKIGQYSYVFVKATRL